MQPITQKILENAISFRTEANADTFSQIFGPLGPHLWGEFKRVDFDVIKLYARLDKINRPKLAAALAPGQLCVICRQAPATTQLVEFELCDECYNGVVEPDAGELAS